MKEAWALFLDIQAAGGIDEYTASGKLAEEVEASYQKRIQAAQTRKQSLIERIFMLIQLMSLNRTQIHYLLILSVLLLHLRIYVQT